MSTNSDRFKSSLRVSSFMRKTLPRRKNVIGLLLCTVAFIGGFLSCDHFGKQTRAERTVTLAVPISTSGQGEVTIVLLVTYMRGGSTFASQLINANSDGFFVFEPLHSIDYANPNTVLTFLNGSTVSQILMANSHTIGLHVIAAFLSCNMKELFVDVLKSGFMNDGKKTAQFHKCGGMKRRQCLSLLEKLCNNSTLRGIKTVSLRLFDVRPLLDRFKSLKVIHLVRDPRAILHSREKLIDVSTFDGKVLCQTMEENLSAFDMLGKLYPGRFKQVMYEDLAENPMQVSEDIYRFWGKQLPPNIKHWISNNTKSKVEQEEVPYGTWRQDSAATAAKWRSTISWPFVRDLDAFCTGLYSKLGLLPFETDHHLRNISFPSRMKKN